MEVTRDIPEMENGRKCSTGLCLGLILVVVALQQNTMTSPSLLSYMHFDTLSYPRMVALGLIGFLVIATVLNLLWQLIISRDRTKPPMVFHVLPWVGSAISYGTDPVNFFFQCRERYGEVFTFILFGRHMTVALGSKGNNFILGGKSTHFSAEDAYTHLTTPVFGKDVVYDCPNDVLMEQKKFVKVGLSTENFRAYVGMIEDEVEEYLKNEPVFEAYRNKNPDQWGSFDSVDTVSEITILTASRTLQGKEVRGDLDKSFSQLYMDLDGGFTPINFLFPNLPLESYRKRDRAHQKMSRFYVDIVNRRRKSHEEHDQDMITALLGQKYRNGRALRDHEIAHIMIALLMAGQHTSSASGSWTLLHLASRPDIAHALYQEQVKYFGRPDGSLRSMTFEELRQLPLLDCVIRETLRIHPPIHSLIRKVRSPVQVPPSLTSYGESSSPLVIPAGNYVLACPAISQIDPLVWKDPLFWDPGRWTDPEGVAAEAFKLYGDEHGEKVDYGFGAVSKGTESPYQPFGAGRHRCIGEQFAYLQLGTIISTLIRKLELKLEGPFPKHNYHTMITLAQKPRMIHYRRRQNVKP